MKFDLNSIKPQHIIVLVVFCSIVYAMIYMAGSNGVGTIGPDSSEGFNGSNPTLERTQSESAYQLPAAAPSYPDVSRAKSGDETPAPVAQDAPYVNPNTGLIIQGPGYEVGEIEGAPELPTSIPSNYYFLDDGAGGEMSIENNLCSKSCCSEQWPTPFKMKYDPYVCQNKDQFVPSNYFCNNTFQDSGCLCLTKKQAQSLYNRGGNGREWF